jgi:hypothetical protein
MNNAIDGLGLNQYCIAAMARGTGGQEQTGRRRGRSSALKFSI